MNSTTATLVVGFGGISVTVIVAVVGFLVKQLLSDMSHDITDIKSGLEVRLTALESWSRFHVEVTHALGREPSGLPTREGRP